MGIWGEGKAYFPHVLILGFGILELRQLTC
jgi:hypothetical protein